MRRPWLVTIVAGCLAIGACEGPTGPTGPQGPAGPQGPQGPQGPAGPGAVSFFFAGQLDAEGATAVQLPGAAGSISRLPQLSCYVGEEQAGPYLSVATDVSLGILCAFAQGTGGALFVVLASAGGEGVPSPFAGWYYQIIVRPQSG